MPATAQLLLPPRELASFISAAIFRDTHSAVLDDAERMNFFPATPLLTVTRVLQGQLHMGHGVFSVEDLRQAPALPPISVMQPSDVPTVSWSPGGIAALTLAIYPEAWAQLTGHLDRTAVPQPIAEALAKIERKASIETGLERFWFNLIPYWEECRYKGPFSDWVGSDKILDWTRHLVTRSALAQRGRSSRSIERMLRQWTGRSRRSLEYYAKLESLHQIRQKTPDADLADTALEANFSDQSHMGRHLKRATGFSPAVLNHKIANEEAFWCYRLLGERF